MKPFHFTNALKWVEHGTRWQRLVSGIKWESLCGSVDRVERKQLGGYKPSTFGGRGGVAPGIFRTEKFCTRFVSHSGLTIKLEISHAS